MNATPRRLSARSRAARCALRWTCRAPRRAATSIASESNQSGPLPRTVFQALAAKATESAIATGRSMWTIRARRPAAAVWKNGRAEKRRTGTATTRESQRKSVSYGEAIPEYSPA